MNDVNVNQLSGGSGRAPQGFDYYAGFMFYGTAPTVSGKWSTYTGTPSIKHQQMFGISDATSAGILPYTENTASQMTFTITNIAANNNTGEIKVTVPLVNGLTSVISLGIYTVNFSTQGTIALQGAAWAAVINNGTATHGWSASFSVATMTLTAPKKYGIALNTGTPYAATVTGTLAVSLTQNSVAGTKSDYALWYYQIKEFFRKFPNGNLRVGIVSASSSFNEIVTLHNASGKMLRHIGVYDNDTTRAAAANISGTLTQLHNAAMTTQSKYPVSVIYSPNIASITDLSTYPNQNLNTAKKAQCVISQDGGAEGALLYLYNGVSVGHIGVKTATSALKRVSASDAQVIDLFNISDGVENDIAAFANGQLMDNTLASLQDQLDAYRYTFVRKFSDTIVGTYWTDNKTCISSTSNYCFQNDNNVVDTITRICYSTYIPLMSSELIYNSNGTLQDYAIESFTDAGEDAINNAMTVGFGPMPLISGVVVILNPKQPVKKTNNLTVNVNYIQNGIARNITVNVSPVDSI